MAEFVQHQWVVQFSTVTRAEDAQRAAEAFRQALLGGVPQIANNLGALATVPMVLARPVASKEPSNA